VANKDQTKTLINTIIKEAVLGTMTKRKSTTLGVQKGTIGTVKGIIMIGITEEETRTETKGIGMKGDMTMVKKADFLLKKGMRVQMVDLKMRKGLGRKGRGNMIIGMSVVEDRMNKMELGIDLGL